MYNKTYQIHREYDKRKHMISYASFFFYSHNSGQYPHAPKPGISFDKQHDFRIG